MFNFHQLVLSPDEVGVSLTVVSLCHSREYAMEGMDMEEVENTGRFEPTRTFKDPPWFSKGLH